MSKPRRRARRRARRHGQLLHDIDQQLKTPERKLFLLKGPRTIDSDEICAIHDLIAAQLKVPREYLFVDGIETTVKGDSSHAQVEARVRIQKSMRTITMTVKL